MRLRRCFSFVAVLGLVAATTQLVYAQQAYVSDDATLLERVGVQDQRIAEQNQRIVELEALLTQREQPFQMRPASWNYDSMMSRIEALELAGKGDGKDGGKGWIDAHDQCWTHQIGGRLLFDYVMFAEQNASSAAFFGDIQNYSEFRSVRLFVEGCGYGVYDYKLEVDFEPEHASGVTDSVDPTLAGFHFGGGPAVRVQDAYIGIRDIPLLGRVALGNQKVPFSLEAQSRLENLTFMERGLPVEPAGRDYAPYRVWPADDDVQLRQVGIAGYNASDCPRWHISYGAFFTDMDTLWKEQPDDRQGITLAARAAWLPWYANEGRHFAHVGAGVQYVDDRDDIVYFAARPEVHEMPTETYLFTKSVTVDSGYFAARDYTRFNLEGALVNGPLSVQGEFFWTRVPDAGEDYYGAYAYASYFLTGEHRGYDPFLARFERVRPLENFWIVNTPDGNCVGSGAWEVAVRWSWVDYSGGLGAVPTAATANAVISVPGADASGVQNDVTLGVNWYWNPHARMMFNYIYATNAYSTNLLTPTEGIFALRWQVDF